jgi:hypothetical protein
LPQNEDFKIFGKSGIYKKFWKWGNIWRFFTLFKYNIKKMLIYYIFIFLFTITITISFIRYFTFSFFFFFLNVFKP